ncbi:carcinoembryonic antigen-related cell adhesion molecule 6-like [Hyperolius riggenbachi]|uniref:carcinoembryonic antigen-related cell adhesion molecule 6-like n=1 Tax=Hyperolius riggenbachi TaxID=752182 RepID=UPI0035A3ACD7
MGRLLCFWLLVFTGAVSGISIFNVTHGGHVYFKETITIHTDPLISWRHNNSLVGQFYNETSQCFDQYTGRCNVTRDGSLRLQDLTYADEGIYEMTAESKENATLIETSTHLLRVYSEVSAVSLTISTTEWLWDGEDSVSLKCSALGSDISFSWNLDGKTLPLSSRYNFSQISSPPSSILTISPVSRLDNGSFTCTVSNEFNNVTSEEVTLQLAWRPEGDIQCSAEPAGEWVSLACSWPGGNPSAQVTYKFSGWPAEVGTDRYGQYVSTNFHGKELICKGQQLDRASQCVLLFGCLNGSYPSVEAKPSKGLSGGETAGIVIGVIFGLTTIIAITVLIVLSRKNFSERRTGMQQALSLMEATHSPITSVLICHTALGTAGILVYTSVYVIRP